MRNAVITFTGERMPQPAPAAIVALRAPRDVRPMLGRRGLQPAPPCASGVRRDPPRIARSRLAGVMACALLASLTARAVACPPPIPVEPSEPHRAAFDIGPWFPIY